MFNEFTLENAIINTFDELIKLGTKTYMTDANIPVSTNDEMLIYQS